MTQSWRSSLGDVGPGPGGGGLRFDLACRNSPLGPGVHHSVEIDEHWNVSVPHDLETERVAVAFGGHLSCLELVDTALPALRRMIQLRHRRRLPAIRPSPGWGRWQLTRPAEGCDCTIGFASSARAAAHERELEHWIRAADPSSSVREVGAVLDHGFPEEEFSPPPRVFQRLVCEPDGLRDLWLQGVPPEYVESAHLAISPGGGPLPRVVFEALAFDVVGLTRLRRAAAEDVDEAGWASLIGTNPPRRSLAGLADELTRTAYTPNDLDRTAALLRGSRAAAVHLLHRWAAIGCEPSAADLEVLLGHRGAAPTPTLGEAQFAFARAQLFDPTVTYDTAVLLLVLTGSATEMMRLLRRGVRSLPDAAEAMARTDTTRGAGDGA